MSVDTDNCKIEYIPILKNGNGVLLADQDSANEILNCFNERTQQIKEPGFVEKRFQQEAQQLKTYYLRKFRGNTFCEKIISKISEALYEKMFYGRLARTEMINCIECEPHRDFIDQILRGV